MKSVKQSKVASTRGEQQHKPVKRGNDHYIIHALKCHKASLLASLIRLLKAPYTTMMAVSVMAIAIALAGSFYVLVSNAQKLVDSFQTGKQISLFLEEQINEQQARSIATELRALESIEKIILISKQQALAEFKQYSGFGAALDALQGNPLPVVLQVYPKESFTETIQLKQLFARMQNQPGVDFAQMDMEWVLRVQLILQVAQRIVLLLSILLALAVIFIAGNTIRSELQTRQNEVVITQLVGGTNAFICLPFLYAGFWYGFISGVLAWCIVFLMLILINAPLEQLSLLYQSPFQLQFLSAGESALLVISASGLGVIGSLVVVSYQLSLLKPE